MRFTCMQCTYLKEYIIGLQVAMLFQQLVAPSKLCYFQQLFDVSDLSECGLNQLTSLACVCVCVCV